MARPALDKKLGMKQEKGKKRGRPPKEKVLQAVKSKPQKKESVRTILRRTTKDKKEAKKEIKPKLSPIKKVCNPLAGCGIVTSNLLRSTQRCRPQRKFFISGRLKSIRERIRKPPPYQLRRKRKSLFPARVLIQRLQR